MGRTNAIETDMTRLKPFNITDPAISAAVTTDILDNFSCVVITTTTTWNAQTLATPTVITDVKRFSVINHDSSTDSITVNGQVVSPGETIYFIWDWSSWVENLVDLTGGVSWILWIANGGTWQTTNEIRIRIPWELIADTAVQQWVYWRNTTGRTLTISNVEIWVWKAAAWAGASASFNVYKSSWTAADWINTNAVNLFTSAIDLTTWYTDDTNVPNTTTVEAWRWITARILASAGATNKANTAEIIIHYT